MTDDALQALETRVTLLEGVAFPDGAAKSDDGTLAITPATAKIVKGSTVDFELVGAPAGASVTLYSEREDIAHAERLVDGTIRVHGVESGGDYARSIITVQVWGTNPDGSGFGPTGVRFPVDVTRQ